MNFVKNMNEKFENKLTEIIAKLIELNKLPKDFDLKNYKIMNPDLCDLGGYQLILHYLNHGIKEQRKYKLIEEYDPNITFTNLEYEFSTSIKNIHINKNKINNLVLLVSKILTSQKPLSYALYRSIYTPQERSQQTEKTIESIRKYIPNSFIILIDNSDFTNHKDLIKNLSVDLFLNPYDLKALAYNTDSMFKQKGEASLTKYVLEFIKYHNIQFNNLFKITGRYFINNSFNYQLYNNDINIFKKNINITNRDYYYTCFFKITYTFFENFLNAINYIITNGMSNSIYIKEYEVLLPWSLKNNFSTVDNLGITQNISVWKDNTDI